MGRKRRNLFYKIAALLLAVSLCIPSSPVSIFNASADEETVVLNEPDTEETNDEDTLAGAGDIEEPEKEISEEEASGEAEGGERKKPLKRQMKRLKKSLKRPLKKNLKR